VVRRQRPASFAPDDGDVDVSLVHSIPGPGRIVRS
jgi:hypothetical protein